MPPVRRRVALGDKPDDPLPPLVVRVSVSDAFPAKIQVRRQPVSFVDLPQFQVPSSATPRGWEPSFTQQLRAARPALRAKNEVVVSVAAPSSPYLPGANEEFPQRRRLKTPGLDGFETVVARGNVPTPSTPQGWQQTEALRVRHNLRPAGSVVDVVFLPPPAPPPPVTQPEGINQYFINGEAQYTFGPLGGIFATTSAVRGTGRKTYTVGGTVYDAK